MARPKPTPIPQRSTPISAAYIRVSRVGGRGEAGEGEFLSPSLQREAAINLSKLHGWQFDDELTTKATDLDVSGRKGNLHKRVGLAALLEAAREGRVQHVIVYKLSRLARSAREGLEIFDQFEALGVSVHVVKEGIDSSTASGRMIRTMLLGVAEMQSEDISEFTKDAAMQRALQGRPHQTPGWIRRGEKVPGEPAEYELVPEIAASVRRMVELRMVGLSYAQIARVLNTEKRPTPSGAAWRSANVAQYLDLSSLPRMRGHSVFGTHLPPGDPARIEIPNAFPALLSEDEYKSLLAVQRVLLDNQVASADTDEINARKGRRYAPTLGSGLVHCAICSTHLRTIRQNYKTTTGRIATSYTCSGAGELGIAHPTYGRSMATTAEGEPDQRQMSLSSEIVDSAILASLITLLAHLEPQYSITQFSTYGLSTCGFSICGKLGYGKPSFFEGSVDGARLDFPPYTRARARSSSSSVSISSVLESKTYETKDDDDRLPKRASTRTHGRKEQAANYRELSAITRDIDDLFDLRSAGRINEGDFDRRYQKLASERETAAAEINRQESSEATQAGLIALRSALIGEESPDVSDELADQTGLEQLRLAAQLFFSRITSPIFLPVKMAPQTGDHKDRARRDRRALACWLRTPLDTGEVVVVSGMYRAEYTGERFCQLLTQAQFDTHIHPWKP